MKKIIFLVFIALVNFSVNAQQKTAFVKAVEKANQSAKFHKQEAISFDIDLIFGGKSSLKGKVISATNSSWLKLIKEDGTIIIFDGQKVWITPISANNGKARFDTFTWQYFFMAPFKFSDQGTIWKELGSKKYDEHNNLEAASLTFEKGVGDASDDYYVVYKDDQDLVKAMGYIVTFGGKSIAEAEKNAHAIVYNDYKKINGVPIAQHWDFHNWNKASGLGSKIGEAKVSNIEFVEASTIDHQKPEGAVEVKM